MFTLALIDDRDDLRTSVATSIRIVLEEHFKEWKLLESRPLPKLSDYEAWILDEEVSVIITDQRLDEAIQGNSQPYRGDQLIESVRVRFPNYPIWVSTSYEKDNDLVENAKETDGIISRESLSDSDLNLTYIQRIIRSGQRFAEERQRLLSELTDLAIQVASGSTPEASIQRDSRIAEIHAQLGHQIISSSFSERAAILLQIREQIDKFESLQTKIASLLGRVSDENPEST